MELILSKLIVSKRLWQRTLDLTDILSNLLETLLRQSIDNATLELNDELNDDEIKTME